MIESPSADIDALEIRTPKALLLRAVAWLADSESGTRTGTLDFSDTAPAIKRFETPEPGIEAIALSKPPMRDLITMHSTF